MTSIRLNLAKALAAFAHEGQLDDGGKPYIDHAARVAEGVAQLGESYEIVGWLHDVLEDSDKVFYADINRLFGNEIAIAVFSMTRGRHEVYADYIQRVKLNPIARMVKISDIRDNTLPDRVASMPEAKRSIVRRYEKALEVLLSDK